MSGALCASCLGLVSVAVVCLILPCSPLAASLAVEKTANSWSFLPDQSQLNSKKSAAPPAGRILPPPASCAIRVPTRSDHDWASLRLVQCHYSTSPVNVWGVSNQVA